MISSCHCIGSNEPFHRQTWSHTCVLHYLEVLAWTVTWDMEDMMDELIRNGDFLVNSTYDDGHFVCCTLNTCYITVGPV
ncbi:hypothetical protein SCLCIDRAFT_799263 [Scleroderma citrinum Foug A]|uniref:Uncharacterized protein n=1 Tax=Scleroderma citrinum Foug A TaxID=1036808 RepID=A0A0C3E2Y6_9AGAM|nr:hypothetical protein SCLCIDRAFT_799263 [Scleroderma citrinum Foug A]